MNAIRAAICEDDAQVLDLLAQSLRRTFAQRGVEAAFDRFAGAEELLAALPPEPGRYDVFFLDIEMGGMDGIELCRQIKRAHAGALVVFVSNKEELVFQSIEVQPFRFVRKSHFVEEQARVVEAIVRELSRSRERFIALEDAGTGRSWRLDVNALSYVEVRGRYCHFHAHGSEEIVIRCRLLDVEQRLEGQRFLKPHRSFLVNADHVLCVDRSAVRLDDGSEVPLSRSRVTETRQELMRYVREDQ
ncbi:MAG TPA: LytTR family DNA-binding domain-containing protein [Candidatus Olsenella pullicola]|nr:LytTR family DNA-binding domain-containing protein [Candidatus Olsenella pullicola]